jgi:predicted nucleotidyltransferase
MQTRVPVLPRAVAETVAVFVDRLRGRFGSRLRDVRLFGSHARSEAGEDSDVDLLVLVDGATREEENEVTDLAADLGWQLHGVALSPLMMSTAEFDAWVARERIIPLTIVREGISL